MIALTQAPATLPEGQRVYAIGDIHGCLDRLAALHALIFEDLIARPLDDVTLIHLGDYIDRGEASAGVLDRLLVPPPVPGSPVPGSPVPGSSMPGLRRVNLMGNHEDMMLAALDHADSGSVFNWLSNGGSDTLSSWGVPRGAAPADWPRYIPPAHIAFLRGLSLSHRQGGYVFVHAGLRPGVALDAQSRQDLLWIREPFLSFTGDLPAVVVHGHTPGRTVVQRANRIGIDTGAVMGGTFSCVVLEGDRMGLLQA